MLMKEPLLAKAWSTDLKQGLPKLLQGQLQSCRSTLALAAVPQDVSEPVRVHGFTKQIAGALMKLPLIRFHQPWPWIASGLDQVIFTPGLSLPSATQ